MSAYVPTTEEVFGAASYGAACLAEEECQQLDADGFKEALTAWLTAHDAEVAAKALEDAAKNMQIGIGDPWNPDEDEQLRRNWQARRMYLFARAAAIRTKPVPDTTNNESEGKA